MSYQNQTSLYFVLWSFIFELITDILFKIHKTVSYYHILITDLSPKWLKYWKNGENFMIWGKWIYWWINWCLYDKRPYILFQEILDPRLAFMDFFSQWSLHVHFAYKWTLRNFIKYMKRTDFSWGIVTLGSTPLFLLL